MSVVRIGNKASKAHFSFSLGFWASLGKIEIDKCISVNSIVIVRMDTNDTRSFETEEKADEFRLQ